MAWTFRNTNTKEQTANSVNVNVPTGTSENDIMIAVVSCGTFGAYPNSVPNGWISLGQAAYGSIRAELFYKIAGASETNYTWGFASSLKVKITILSGYGGFDTADPIDIVSNTGYTVGTNNIARCASMVVSAANSVLILIGLTYSSSARSFTKPTAPADVWTEHYDGWGTTNWNCHQFCSMVWTGSGASGDIDATINESTGTKHCFGIALNPPSAPSSAIKSINGLAKASVNKINGLAIASVKSWNGLA